MAEQSKITKWLQDKVFNPLEDKKMPVMQHLFEFQKRLTKIVVIVALFFVGTFFYADTLVQWLRIPLQNMFVPGNLEWVPTDLPKIPFIFLSPAEALWQNLKVAALFALVLATPYILWEIWSFVVPGLHVQERRFVAPFVMTSAVAFYLGLGFCFFFVLPFALNFLISYGVKAGFIPQLSIASYVGFALWFLVVFGLIFEVPLALTLMAKLGWVDAPFLKRYRKWGVFGIVSFCRAFNAGRPIPLTNVSWPCRCTFFYEVGIISAGFFKKKPEATEEEETAASPESKGSGALQPQTATSGHDDEYVGCALTSGHMMGRRGLGHQQ